MRCAPPFATCPRMMPNAIITKRNPRRFIPRCTCTTGDKIGAKTRTGGVRDIDLSGASQIQTAAQARACGSSAYGGA